MNMAIFVINQLSDTLIIGRLHNTNGSNNAYCSWSSRQGWHSCYCYVHPKFGLYRSVDVDTIPQKQATYNGRNHWTKPPIYGQWGIKAREVALLTLPNLQLSAISVIERRQVACEVRRFKLSIIGRAWILVCMRACKFWQCTLNGKSFGRYKS